MRFKIVLAFLIGSTLTFGQAYLNIPINLSMPFDMDTIETQEPTFSWQCDMATIQNDPRLSLQFILTSLFESQQKSEAIAINEPLYVNPSLNNATLSYPSTIEKLEKGKTYVWQLQLMFNGLAIQYSEPWQFTIADPRKPKDQYFLLRKTPDASFYTVELDEIRLKVQNLAPIKNFNATIRNSKNEMHKVVLKYTENEDDRINSVNSSNYYLMIDLKELELEEDNYVFEWKYNNTPYYLNFKYIK